MSSFHPEPYEEISRNVAVPREFINHIYRELLDVRPYFPGENNRTGFCMDRLMARLESMGAVSEFDDDW